MGPVGGRRVEVHHVSGEGSALYRCFQHVSMVRVMRNFLLAVIARYLPWFGVKNALYRMMGMKVGRRVAFGLMAMVDVVFPELISIGDDAVIGYNTVILTHEFLIEEWRRGPVELGRRVLVGANCTILPGVRIGDGAVVSAHSLVNRDVRPGDRVGGVPIRSLHRVAEDDH